MSRIRKLRPMTDSERTALERLARSRSDEFRLVERARAILAVYRGQRINATAQEAGHTQQTVSSWISNFEALGLEGLHDAPKSSRPSMNRQAQKRQLTALARTHPEALDLGLWTLDQLTAIANDQLQIPISRAELARVMEAEGIRWYEEEVAFSDRPDPQFAEQSGPFLHSINRSRRTPT